MKDIRKVKRVRIVTSDMNLYAFKLHISIKVGYIFAVKREYIADTKAKTPMYELCGSTGKVIGFYGRPCRNKVQRTWTQPVSTWEYLCERYGPNPLHVLTGALKEIVSG